MTMHDVCPMWASAFIVPSSDSEKDYMVKFFPTQKAMCSCPAYRFSGEYDQQTCKHIRQVKTFGCFYLPFYSDPIKNLLQAGHDDLEKAGIVLFSTTKNNLTDKKCPSCDRPMVEVTI